MSESLPRAVSQDERDLIGLLEWLSEGQVVHAGGNRWYASYQDIVEEYNSVRINSPGQASDPIGEDKATKFMAWVCDGEVVEFDYDEWADTHVRFTGDSTLIHHLVCSQYPRDVANGEG